ncbi:MAG: 30S ribosomal protein S8 [Firmicutes bacterium]|nr:30S ribosomal protein S8 [Bacillota bacterium]
MVTTDPIADMLTRIRNANSVFHNSVDIPGSKMKLALAKLLKDEGYIKDYRWIDDGNQGLIRIYLKYTPDKERTISGLKRISRPGRRVYAKHDEIPKVLGGLGVAVVSTSQGLMSDREARKAGVGGEIVCFVW